MLKAPQWLNENQTLHDQDKKIQAEIFRDHKKLAGMSDMNAKYHYCQLVLFETFGITFSNAKKTHKRQRFGQQERRFRPHGITKEKK